MTCGNRISDVWVITMFVKVSSQQSLLLKGFFCLHIHSMLIIFMKFGVDVPLIDFFLINNRMSSLHQVVLMLWTLR